MRLMGSKPASSDVILLVRNSQIRCVAEYETWQPFALTERHIFRSPGRRPRGPIAGASLPGLIAAGGALMLWRAAVGVGWQLETFRAQFANVADTIPLRVLVRSGTSFENCEGGY